MHILITIFACLVLATFMEVPSFADPDTGTTYSPDNTGGSQNSTGPSELPGVNGTTNDTRGSTDDQGMNQTSTEDPQIPLADLEQNIEPASNGTENQWKTVRPGESEYNTTAGTGFNSTEPHINGDSSRTITTEFNSSTTPRPSYSETSSSFIQSGLNSTMELVKNDSIPGVNKTELDSSHPTTQPVNDPRSDNNATSSNENHLGTNTTAWPVYNETIPNPIETGESGKSEIRYNPALLETNATTSSGSSSNETMIGYTTSHPGKGDNATVPSNLTYANPERFPFSSGNLQNMSLNWNSTGNWNASRSDAIALVNPSTLTLLICSTVVLTFR